MDRQMPGPKHEVIVLAQTSDPSAHADQRQHERYAPDFSRPSVENRAHCLAFVECGDPAKITESIT